VHRVRMDMGGKVLVASFPCTLIACKLFSVKVSRRAIVVFIPAHLGQHR